MKVKDLIQELKSYSPNMDVRIAMSPVINDIKNIDVCVNMDTNQVECVIYGGDK